MYITSEASCVIDKFNKAHPIQTLRDDLATTPAKIRGINLHRQKMHKEGDALGSSYRSILIRCLIGFVDKLQIFAINIHDFT